MGEGCKTRDTGGAKRGDSSTVKVKHSAKESGSNSPPPQAYRIRGVPYQSQCLHPLLAPYGGHKVGVQAIRWQWGGAGLTMGLHCSGPLNWWCSSRHGARRASVHDPNTSADLGATHLQPHPTTNIPMKWTSGLKNIMHDLHAWSL